MLPIRQDLRRVAAIVHPLRRVIAQALHQSTQRAGERSLPPHQIGATSSRSGLPASAKASTPGRTRPSASRNGRGVTVASSGSRLADLSRPARSGSRPGGPAPILDNDEECPRRPKEPSYNVFKATTYQVPKSDMAASEAASKRFDEFEIHPKMLPAVYQRLGAHVRTTPIQSLAFRHFFPFTSPGQRVLLGAETGSGKTMAYLVPMLTNLKLTETDAMRATDLTYSELLPRAIILSPTHELNRQTTATAKSLLHSTKLSVLGMSETVDGGIGLERGGKDVLCGTVAMTRRMLGIKKPGGDDMKDDRKRKPWVLATRLDWVVIDEADVLLGKDFQEETLAVLQHLAADRPDLNIVLCTATVPPLLLHTLSNEPFLASKPFAHLFTPSLHKLPENLQARFVRYHPNINPFAQVAIEMKRVMGEDGRERREIVDSGTLMNRSKFVVFCNSDEKVQALSKAFTERQLPNLAWTGAGETRKKGRDGLLKYFLLDPKARPDEAFKPVPQDDATPRILITTSILSRGLDFHPLVSTVFLVDEPRDVLDFVHRAGRAGRAGRKGRVVVFGLGQKGRKSLAEKVGALTGMRTNLAPPRGGSGVVKRRQRQALLKA